MDPQFVALIQSYLSQGATLGGFAALIAVLVNLGKLVGVVGDSNAPTFSTVLNFVVLVFLVVAHIVSFDVASTDSVAAGLATIGTTLLALLGMLLVSKATHLAVKTVPVVGYSHTTADAKAQAKTNAIVQRILGSSYQPERLPTPPAK